MNKDDAAGGLRGLRATPSPQLFEALRDHYGVEEADGSRDLGGSSSLNLLVIGDEGRCVVRVYRPYVTAARLEAIQAVRRHLSRGGVPCAEVVATRDGQPWIALDGRLVEMERYVEHDAEMDSWERLQAGLPWLGRIHTLLRSIEVSADGQNPVFANHIEPHDTLARTLHGTQRIRGWNPSPEELRLAEAAENLAHLVSAAEQEFASTLPQQLVHGDFWDNNVFFRKGEVALVADFDFMGERARIDDLALTLYYTCFLFLEEGLLGSPLQRLRVLIDAYDRELAEPLSSAERAALPWAIARQPLWSIGGWVALLDDESRARQHAARMHGEVEWALRIVREVERWQEAFA